jgi:hypothetical protein
MFGQLCKVGTGKFSLQARIPLKKKNSEEKE